MRNGRFVLAASLAVLAAVSMTAAASAHGVWFAKRLGRMQLILGEGADDRAYDPSKVLFVQGYDADYKKVDVKPVNGWQFITIEPAENLAATVTAFSYGYWTVTDGKWKRLSDEDVKTAKDQITNMKYDVHYFASVKEPKPVEGIPYQIVPMSDPTALKVGDTLVVQALHDGKPMADTEIIPDFVTNPEGRVKTDAEGKASITVRGANFNVIGLELFADSYSDPNNPNVTKGTFASCLSFLVK